VKTGNKKIKVGVKEESNAWLNVTVAQEYCDRSNLVAKVKN